jgi:hypothetical protein
VLMEYHYYHWVFHMDKFVGKGVYWTTLLERNSRDRCYFYSTVCEDSSEADELGVALDNLSYSLHDLVYDSEEAPCEQK